MARRRGIITLALIAAMSFSHAPITYAQFGGVVYDPANFKQNFLTAVRSYTALLRQAQQLRNEAQMLINDAKQLSRLDFSSQSRLLAILDEITWLNQQAENVAYEVNRTRQIVRETYPETYDDFTEDEMVVRAEEQWQMSRRAYNDTMVMQSKMVESITSDKQLLGQLMTKSQSSVGELQATQSTNQLLALLIKQIMQMQQMQVTQGRADAVEQARRLAIEKESKQKRQHFVGSKSAYAGGGK